MRRFRIALALLFAMSSGTLALAQTWVPPKGQGTLAVAYQYSDVAKHLFSEVVEGSDSHDLGEIDSQTLAFGAQYGFTNRLALDGQFAYVTSRYVGDFAENPEIDDGAYHGAMQDLRLGVRYMAVNRHWNLTPAAHLVVPSHDYDVLGHSAVGRGLTELQLGLNAGKLFGYGVAKCYLQGNYTYAFVEKVEDISVNRSDASLEFGYFLGRTTLRAFGAYQDTHGGIDWATDIHDEHSFDTHDVAAAAQFYRAGVGVSFPVSRKIYLYGNYIGTISGQNTHDIGALSIGMAWGFQGALDFGRAQAKAGERPEERAGLASVAIR